MIDFDCETTGLQPWSGTQHAFLYLFFDGVNPPEAIPYDPSDPDNWNNPEYRAMIQAWFDKAKVDPEGIRAWNSNFDRSFADAAGFDVPGDGHWHDGMIEAHAIDERRSVALKAVAVSLFGEDSDDLQKEVKKWLTDERKRRKKEAQENGTELVEPNYSDVPMSLMEPYGKEDVILTRKVCDNYAPMIANSSWLREIIDFERKVMDALYHVQKRGIPASIEGYRKLEIEVAENLEGLEDRCIELAEEAGVEDFNPRSSQQILAALKAREADLTFVTDEKMDAENLQHVDDPLAEAVLAFRSENKVLTTYVRPMIGRHYTSSMRMWKEPFIGPDGCIHASYRQLGARTGRMSCSDPNMQNQPRDDLRLRYNIVAQPGFSLVTCDLSNIEMRLFAAYAGDGALRDAVRAGKDLHTMTAEFIGIRDRVRAGGAVESARQRGKTFNFSIIYGGGIRTIRKQQRCSQDEARLMKRRYYDAYPEVDRLQRRIEYRLSDDGYITSLWGRRMRVDVKDSYRAVNYLVQGSAADLLKQALIDLHAMEVPVVALIHDEIMAHVPTEQAEETKATIIRALTAAAEPGGKLWDDAAGSAVVPLEAEGVVVQRWSDAKPLKDDDGRVYLFTPQWAGGEKRYV